MGGSIGGGWLLRLVVVSFLVVCEGRRFGVSLGVGYGGWVLVAWGLGVECGVGVCVLETVGGW